MADQQHHINFSLADIERYLQGRMSAAEMHEMEKIALQDPFLADALEGYADASATVSHRHLDEITQALLSAPEEKGKIVPLPRSAQRSWLKIAAAVILLAGTGALGWYFIQSPQQTTALVQHNTPTDHPVQVVVPPPAPADTIRPAAPAQPGTGNNNTRTAVTPSGSIRNAQPAAPMIAATPAAPLVAADQALPDSNLRAMASRQLPARMSSQVPGIAISRQERQDSTHQLNEVVVVGFGAQKKAMVQPSLQKADTGIEASEAEQSLSEIVVTEMHSRKRAIAATPTTDSVYPVGGWQSFHEYAARKLHKDVDTTGGRFTGGEIEVEFMIEANGDPRNVTIIRSPDSTINKQAIDVLKNGPRWISGNKKCKTRVIMRY